MVAPVPLEGLASTKERPMQNGRAPVEPADAAGSKAVERVAAIVMTLAEEARPMGIAEVSEAASLPQATVHRLLNALVNPGWVEKDPSTGRYRLGHGLLGPSVATLSHSPLVENGQSIVNRAAEMGGHGANSVLSVLVGRTVVYLARSSQEQERGTLLPGFSRPAHASASGKVLLAFMEPEARRRLYRGQRQLRQFTPKTIPDVESLEAQLAGVRENGYAVEKGEYREYIINIAVPVHGADGKVVAALTCGGRPEIMSPEHTVFVREELTHLAEDLSSLAGFRD
jgi:DNA-binding IclR family transcriptional regulator